MAKMGVGITGIIVIKKSFNMTEYQMAHKSNPQTENKSDLLVEPRPREARLTNCVMLSLYGSSFLFFLTPWMNKNAVYFVIKFSIIYLLCVISHFLILYKRQLLYDILCRLTRSRIRFFEFPYFVFTAVFYFLMFIIFPFSIGLVQLHDGIGEIFRDQDLTMFLLFGGGAGFVAAAISGFDIYPVNIFGTKSSLEYLITITRDLMKYSNRLIAIVTGAIVIGWAFKKVEFSLGIVYLTTYGILGFAIGGTGVLGARVTELLYILSDLERTKGPQKTH